MLPWVFQLSTSTPFPFPFTREDWGSGESEALGPAQRSKAAAPGGGAGCLHTGWSVSPAVIFPATDLRGCFVWPVAQTAVDCLILWKLTRVGEVGMDMARATRARMECLSCHRCHLFRTAERTCGHGAET